ncbi:hypothetical protein [Massilia sp. Leaf139]|uniref:hypothetical protein n=1 Tax=Massilia sp. Leaf139 TaxID=1736272 RepID=UPI0012E921FB|nr:hypothetical protein [Massilia sp. Leaf139]
MQRIPRKYDPSLVGADGFIGFLPNAMQAYKDKGVLAFVSFIRTKGGNGSGQCSAGAEIFLNFLDVRAAAPKILSSILIDSCNRPIELMDRNSSTKTLGKLSVVNKRITLHFLSYCEGEGYPIATVSADLKQLEF